MITVSNNLPTLEKQESVEDLGVDPAKVMLGVASNFGASMRGPGKERIEYGSLVLYFCLLLFVGCLVLGRRLGASQTKGFRPLLEVFFPSIYRIFRASHNANRWCIINQMFANSLPVDARVKNYR